MAMTCHLPSGAVQLTFPLDTKEVRSVAEPEVSPCGRAITFCRVPLEALMSMVHVVCPSTSSVSVINLLALSSAFTIGPPLGQPVPVVMSMSMPYCSPSCWVSCSISSHLLLRKGMLLALLPLTP